MKKENSYLMRLQFKQALPECFEFLLIRDFAICKRVEQSHQFVELRAMQAFQFLKEIKYLTTSVLKQSIQVPVCSGFEEFGREVYLHAMP